MLLSRTRELRLGLVLLAMVVAWGHPVQAQMGTVTGEIINLDTRLPIGATQVFISELDLGVLSEVNGRYVISNVPPGTHAVTAERLGFSSITQEIVVGAGQSAVVDFELSEAALQLDEIIVTGTAGGTQRRAVGNAVSQLEVDPLARVAPVQTLEQAIGANVPGLVMQASGSAPGQTGGDIRIRGSSSQALSNSPIVYIDGVRMEGSNANSGSGTGQRSRLDDINPEDIESIEVIKGPAAATLYGTEASNGVIQIITKRGAVGTPVFDASMGGGVRWLHNPSKVFGTVYGTHPDTHELLSMNVYDSEERRLGYPIYEYGNQFDADLQARGGTESFRYFISGARSRAQGIRDYNVATNTSVRTSISFLPREDLDIRATLGYNIEETRAMGAEYTDMYWAGPDDRVFEGGVDGPSLGFFRVPPEERRNEIETVDRDRTNLSVEVNFRPFPWLSNRLIFGKDLNYEGEGYLLPRQPGGTSNPFFRSTGDGRRILDTRKIDLGTFDYNLTASLGLTDNIGSATSFGVQYYSNVTTFHRSQGDDFATPALTTVSAAGQNSASETFVENVTLGFFVQQQFDWAQRIFLTGAVRRDDNSAFGSEFSGATYPKASATWVVSEESFWNVDFMNTLRIRGAWGQAGQQPDVFAATRLFEPVPGVGFEPILTPQTIGNPDLGPEKGEELELGFDATLFDSRVSLEFTGYWRDTKDAIVTKQVAPSLGFPGTQLVNVGGIKSWGTETAIGVAVLTENPVRWDLQASFASQNNEIEDLGGSQIMIPVRRARHHIEGFPLASIFGYEILFAEFENGTSGPVNQDTWLCDGGAGKGGREVGGEAVNCNDAPLLFQGSGEPHYIVNFTSTWTLWEDLQIYGSIDGFLDYWSVDDGCAANHLTVRNSLLAQTQDDPIFVAHMNLRRQGACEYKNGFLKLRELGARYELPTSLTDRVGASRASISVGARNLNLLYRAQEWTDFGIRIADPEGYLASENFGGETRLILPPQVLLNAVLRVSF